MKRDINLDESEIIQYRTKTVSEDETVSINYGEKEENPDEQGTWKIEILNAYYIEPPQQDTKLLGLIIRAENIDARESTPREIFNIHSFNSEDEEYNGGEAILGNFTKDIGPGETAEGGYKIRSLEPESNVKSVYLGSSRYPLKQRTPKAVERTHASIKDVSKGHRTQLRRRRRHHTSNLRQRQDLAGRGQSGTQHLSTDQKNSTGRKESER